MLYICNMKNKIPDTKNLTFEKVWLMFQETGQKMEKLSRETDLQMKETDKKINKLSELYGGVSHGLGYAAEDYFFNAIDSNLTIDNVKYNYIIKNDERKLGEISQEYDIVIVNDSKIIVVEVKHNFYPSDVEKFTKKMLPKFYTLHPEYKSHTVYGAIAGITMQQETKELANENGLYIFTQSQDDNNIKLLNIKGFVPKKYE